MQFTPTEEQLALAEAIDDIALGLGGTAAARAWGQGEHAPGIALWQQFTELGLGGLIVDENAGGMGGNLTDLVVAFERLAYHAVPGPYVESIALLPNLVSQADRDALLAGAMGTAQVAIVHPLALDADAAALRFVINETAGQPTIAAGTAGGSAQSISPMRRLSELAPEPGATPIDPKLLSVALDRATLANTAMLLGAGERLLAEAVSYAKVREQFGRAIGEYQSLKHQLADVRVALSFAKPLAWQAAIALDAGSATAARDVSAAKIVAANAATLAARTSLQVHGAIGYTAEHDLSLWLNWVPALVAVWGTPSAHRDRVAQAVLAR